MSIFRKLGALFGRFLLVGLTGTLVNLAALWLLVRLGLPSFIAALIATEASIINNFIWNDCWTFKQQGQLSLAARFGRFQVITSLTAVLSLGVFLFLSSSLHLHYLLAQLSGIGLATLLNFGVNVRFTWKLPPVLTLPTEVETPFPNVSLGKVAEENAGI